MTFAELIAKINEFIATNGNNEITAAVLNPILKDIAQWAKDTTGDLSELTTDTQANLVDAINELNEALQNINNGGVQIYQGTDDPNETPPLQFSTGDFYLQVDGSNNPIQLYQYNGFEWIIPSDQDNITIRKYFAFEQGSTSAQILDAINNIPAYNLTEQESVLLIGREYINTGGNINYTGQLYKYEVIGKGKGNYSLLNPLELSNIELIYQGTESLTDIENDPDTVIINFDPLTDPETVSQWLNEQSVAIDIQPQDEGYTLFKGTVDGVETSYLWIGAAGLYGVGEEQSTMADFEELSDQPPVPFEETGLVKITEGLSTGYRLKEESSDNHGTIGQGAVDLSISNTPGNNGATGEYSFAEGFNNQASGTASHAEGSGNIASHTYSHAEGNGNTAGNTGAHAEGGGNSATGVYSHVEGEGNFAKSRAEHSGGRWGTDYTTTGTDSDRLVNYGNGTSSSSRSDAYTLYKNGLLRLPSVTTELIDEADGKAVIVKEYMQGILENKADLVSGKVPASQLPSFVDDVLEYVDLASFPVTGEDGKLYVALDTNLVYRWSGSTYVEISPSVIPTLQEVTDAGNTTTGDIKAFNYYTKSGVNEFLFAGEDGKLYSNQTFDVAGTNGTGTFDAGALTDNRNYGLPNASGTIALKETSVQVIHCDTVDSTPITGTTSEVLTSAHKIDANSVAIGNLMLYLEIEKTGTAGTIMLRVYKNTANTLDGNQVQIGTATVGATQLFYPFSRRFRIKADGNIYGYPFIVGAAQDAPVVLAQYDTPFNTAVDEYILVTLQPTSTGDAGLVTGLETIFKSQQ